jgi:aldose 1-epimerase
MNRVLCCAAAIGLGAVAMAWMGCSHSEQKATAKQPASTDQKNRSKVDTTKPREAKISIHKESFGKTPDGAEVDLYTLSNSKGLRVKIMTYGAIITAVETPDRNGKIENIALSLDSLQDYIKGHPYFGATVGRYGNRIAKGKFSIDGK